MGIGQKNKFGAGMKVKFFTIVRMLAVLLGIFLIMLVSADLLGLVPSSNETPLLKERFQHSIMTLAFGVALVVPYRFVIKSYRFYPFIIFLLTTSAWRLRWHLYHFQRLRAGEMDDAGVPILLGEMAIIILNIGAILKKRTLTNRRTPRSN